MDTTRRGLLQAAVCCIAKGIASRDARAQGDPAVLPPQTGDLLVRPGDAAHTPLTPDDVAAGAPPITAWPLDPVARAPRSGTRLNQILLLRLDVATLIGDTRTRAAGGILAYTAICTHQGCDVDDWLAKEQALSCSCHSSIFDPRDGASVVDGPAPRPLPALPLRVVGGRLTVAAPFTSKVGFEKG